MGCLGPKRKQHFIWLGFLSGYTGYLACIRQHKFGNEIFHCGYMFAFVHSISNVAIVFVLNKTWTMT
jgi:hypothetical protein